MKRTLPLVLFLIVAGCNAPPSQIGGKLPEKVYARVISLSPSLTELVALLNSTNLLIGRTAGDERPAYIKQITIVANPLPDIEKIVKLQPDLIIVEENLINAADMAKLKGLKGIDIEVFNIDSIKQWEESVWKLGNLLQSHTRASDVIDRVHQAQANATLPKSMYRPKVLVAMSAAPPWVAATGSYQADVVRAAGGEPVGPSGDRFFAVNPEDVVKWNPDIAFVSDSVGKFSGPAWGATRAGRDSEVLQVDPNILLRTGADLEKLIDAMSKEIRRVGSTR
ncbi:MAG: helical backbone metal receptor [Armatimonadota bacterium]|nr:helical backbone metal receptor [Armatimonadota bacterium]